VFRSSFSPDAGEFAAASADVAVEQPAIAIAALPAMARAATVIFDRKRKRVLRGNKRDRLRKREVDTRIVPLKGRADRIVTRLVPGAARRGGTTNSL
jgi:hypothetical protein